MSTLNLPTPFTSNIPKPSFCPTWKTCFICKRDPDFSRFLANDVSPTKQVLLRSESDEKPKLLDLSEFKTPKRKTAKRKNPYATRANLSPNKAQPLRFGERKMKTHLQKFLVEQQKLTSLSQQATEDVC